MSEGRGLTALALFLVLVLLLTGGLGLLVPPIQGLGRSEFQGIQLLWALLAGLTLLPLLAAGCARAGAPRVARCLLLAWPLSVLLNLGLGQDPLGAALNWRVGRADFEERPSYREWGVVTLIGNHEHVTYDPEAGCFLVRQGA